MTPNNISCARVSPRRPVNIKPFFGIWRSCIERRMVKAQGASDLTTSQYLAALQAVGSLASWALSVPSNPCSAGLPVAGTCLSLGFGIFPVAPPPQRVVLTPHTDRLTESTLRLSQGCPSGSPSGTCLSLGFGAFPAAPPAQGVVLSPHTRQAHRSGLTAFPGLPIRVPVRAT